MKRKVIHKVITITLMFIMVWMVFSNLAVHKGGIINANASYPKFSLNDVVGVNNVGDAGLNLRSGPGTSSTILKKVPDGWAFRIISSSPVYNKDDGYNWWKVREEKYETYPVEGWVAENYIVKVSPQNLVPPSPPDYFVSNPSKIEEAIAWALAQKDKTDWSGYCLRFVREAFKGKPIPGWDTAENARRILEAEGKFYSWVNCWNPPRGALIFFSTTGPYAGQGHVGIYLGDQKVVHAYGKVRVDEVEDGKKGGIVIVEKLTYIDSYIGWAYPPEEWMLFDFSISVLQSSRTITVGQSTSYDITVSLISGTPQTVTLSLSGQHSTMSYSFKPASGSPTFTSTLTISTSSSTPANTYTLTITGTGGGLTRRNQVTLVVETLTPETDYPSAKWVAASSYTPSNRPSSYPIRYVVIHVAQGTYAGTISWFKNPDAKVSAHYVISSDGEITQMVRHKDIAWHAGNWDYNTQSIGIEHEGWVDQPYYFTDQMYRASASLTRYICDLYGIPKDRTHIIGHNEIPGASHTDPGPYWNWDYYMQLVIGATPTPTPPSVTTQTITVTTVSTITTMTKITSTSTTTTYIAPITKTVTTTTTIFTTRLTTVYSPTYTTTTTVTMYVSPTQMGSIESLKIRSTYMLPLSLCFLGLLFLSSRRRHCLSHGRTIQNFRGGERD
jgi:N-acetyl-anhydromuramyl-L-alanine amidase AmpD